jgi:hypothetical protein
MVQQIKNETLSNQNKRGKSSPKTRTLSNAAMTAQCEMLDLVSRSALFPISGWQGTTGAARNKVEATASLLRTVRAFR